MTTVPSSTTIGSGAVFQGLMAVTCCMNSVSFGYSEKTPTSQPAGVGVANTRLAISAPARWASTTSPTTKPAIPMRELGIELTMKSTPARRAASSVSSRASLARVA